MCLIRTFELDDNGFLFLFIFPQNVLPRRVYSVDQQPHVRVRPWDVDLVPVEVVEAEASGTADLRLTSP